MEIVSRNFEQKQGTCFHHFFNDELKGALWCELIVREMMPFLIKHCQSEELVRMLSLFFQETENHVDQLEEVFSELKMELEEKECDTMKGMIDNIWLISCTIRGKVRDAAILLIVQKIISHQIVSYRALNMYMQRMKKFRAGYIIGEVLEEKKMSDNKFNNLSVYINSAAMLPDHPIEEVMRAEV